MTTDDDRTTNCNSCTSQTDFDQDIDTPSDHEIIQEIAYALSKYNFWIIFTAVCTSILLILDLASDDSSGGSFLFALSIVTLFQTAYYTNKAFNTGDSAILEKGLKRLNVFFIITGILAIFSIIMIIILILLLFL